MLSGDNSILTKAGEAKTKTQIAKVKEAIAIAQAEAVGDHYLGASSETIEAQVLTKLHDAGYTTDSESSGTLQGISIDKSSVTIEEGGSTETAIVTLSASNGSTNYVLIDGLYYKLTKTNGDLTLEETGKRELTNSSVSFSDITITPTGSLTASLSETTPTTGTLTITSTNVTADENSDKVELKYNDTTYGTIDVAVKKANFALAATKASTKIGGTTTLSANLADYQKGEVSWAVTAGGNYATVPENSTGTSVQVTGVAGGTATVRATYRVGTKTVTKTASVEIKQGTLDAQGITWANLSTYAKQISGDDDIDDYAAGPIEIGGKTLSIGDTKILEIGSDVYLAQIIGFKHDNLANDISNSANTAYGTYDSSNPAKAGITFQLKELMKTKHNMNATYTNANGWYATSMRSYLNTDSGNVYSQINSDARNVIVTVKKDYKASYNATTAATTPSEDKLWLLAFSEIWSTNPHIEGEQYQYYINATTNSNSTISYSLNNDNLKKYQLDSTIANQWWLRSTPSNNYYQFSYVANDGSCNWNTATVEYSVSFGFSI